MLIEREKNDVLRVIKNFDEVEDCLDAGDVEQSARARILNWIEEEGDLWAEAVFDWYDWDGNPPPPEKKYDVCQYVRKVELADWAEGEWEAMREARAEYYDNMRFGGWGEV